MAANDVGVVYKDLVTEVPEATVGDLTAANMKMYINDGTDFYQVGFDSITATAAEARTYLGIPSE